MSQDVTGVMGAQSADNSAPRIIDFRHPAYSRMSLFWQKWRFVYAGGDDFSEQFLEKYSDREDTESFNLRRRVTPSPSFAKAAVNDIKNSIFQRMNDIVRQGGSNSYMQAIKGLDNGVDLHGSTMNNFMGRYVLPELLTMAKVGVFVDMPDNVGDTMLTSSGKNPYLYMYRPEQILSWTYRTDKADEFASVLLVDYVDDLETASNLPIGTWARYRHIWVDQTDGKVHVQYFDEDNGYVDRDGQPSEGEYILEIDFIPLVVMELSDSLLADVANHQIALLNLESSDVLYALKSNFPFYVEQRDNRMTSPHLKGNAPNGEGTAASASGGTNPEIEVGTMQGRAYDKGMERPGFIHPSAEPLTASMAKQKQLKDDIRQLVNLALSNIKPKMASAESKAIDERGLESGLAYVGLELEHGERKIARYWAMYEGTADVAQINYPAKYQLQSDEDRRAAVKNLEEVRDKVFSPTFRKAITKQISRMLLDGYVDEATLQQISKEIDESVAIVSDPATTLNAVQQGVCDLDLAGKILGYPEGTAQKAAEDHSARLIRIMKAQGIAEVQTGRQNTVINDPNNPGTDNASARGANDLSGTPGAGGKQEKANAQDQTTNAQPGDPTRGQGKG